MSSIGELFSAEYGDKRYENKEHLKRQAAGTPLIASGAKSNGVYGRFAIPATKKNIVTVARTGSVGAAFFHGYPCEVSSDALVLTPLDELSTDAMVWYACAISLNRFRFSYGRKVTPDRVRRLNVPELNEQFPRATVPTLVEVSDEIASELIGLDACAGPDRRAAVRLTEPTTVGDMFDIEYGNSYELCYLKLDKNGVNFVSRTTRNNGVSARVARTSDKPFPAGCLTVALGSQGGVLETSVQFAPFYTGRDVAVLKPKLDMTLEEKLFCCLAIKLHKFRFSFGRQANRTLPELRLPPLPKWAEKIRLDSVQDELAEQVRNMFS